MGWHGYEEKAATVGSISSSFGSIGSFDSRDGIVFRLQTLSRMFGVVRKPRQWRSMRKMVRFYYYT